MTSCIFCFPDFINGLTIGIISSAIVAIATYIIVNRKHVKDLKKKYGKAAGKYKGYGFEAKDETKSTIDDSNRKWTLKEQPISETEIEYIRDNHLKIKLTHNGLTWEGNIIMELETLGSVAWQYTNLPKTEGKEQHRFGLKTCIVRNVEEENYVYVYLIGNQMEGYGKEILIREK